MDYHPRLRAQSGRGGHPANIFFLTCDAFGVLPPLARLTPEQAMYHFLSGYTAKVAGTEAGVTEPQATFSTCFAAPFLPLPPTRYAELLRERLERHRAAVWLVNTGWTGGAYGVGRRMPLAHTRALLRAVLAGQLADVPYDGRPGLRRGGAGGLPGRAAGGAAAAADLGGPGGVRRPGAAPGGAVPGELRAICCPGPGCGAPGGAAGVSNSPITSRRLSGAH